MAAIVPELTAAKAVAAQKRYSRVMINLDRDLEDEIWAWRLGSVG